MYQARSTCIGLRRSSRRNAAGCGAFRIASRSTTSGWKIAAPQATDPTPVVPDHVRAFRPECSDQRRHVARQRLVVVPISRLRAQVVAAQVRRHHPEPLGQGRDLRAPAVPEFWEAVEQQHQRPAPIRRPASATPRPPPRESGPRSPRRSGAARRSRPHSAGAGRWLGRPPAAGPRRSSDGRIAPRLTSVALAAIQSGWRSASVSSSPTSFRSASITRTPSGVPSRTCRTTSFIV